MIHLSTDVTLRVLSYLSPSDQSRVATVDQTISNLVRMLQNPTSTPYYLYSGSYTGTLRGREVVRITPHLPNELEVSRESSHHIIYALTRYGFEKEVLRDASHQLIKTIPRGDYEDMEAFYKTGRITNPEKFRKNLRHLFLLGMNTNHDLLDFSLSDSSPVRVSEAILNPLLPYFLTAPEILEDVVNRISLAPHLTAEAKQRCINQLQPPAIQGDDFLVKKRKIDLYLHAYKQKPADGRFVRQMLLTPYNEWGPLVEAWINDNNLATLALGSLLIPDQHLPFFHDAIISALLRGQHALFHDMRLIASIWLNRFGFVLDPTSIFKETYHFKRLEGAPCPLPPQLNQFICSDKFKNHWTLQHKKTFLHSYEKPTLDKADRYFSLTLPSTSIKKLVAYFYLPSTPLDPPSKGYNWYTAFPHMRQGDADLLCRALESSESSEISSILLSLSESGKASFSHELSPETDPPIWHSAIKHCLSNLAEPWTTPIRERWMKNRFQFTEAQYAVIRFQDAIHHWHAYCTDKNAVRLSISQALEALPPLEKYLFFEELWKQINQTLPLKEPTEDAEVWFEKRLKEYVPNRNNLRILRKAINQRSRDCRTAAILPPFDIDAFILECDQHAEQFNK